MFDIEAIMEANKCTRENNFGFNEGQPCILLKMNKVSVKKVNFRATVERLKEKIFIGCVHKNLYIISKR